MRSGFILAGIIDVLFYVTGRRDEFKFNSITKNIKMKGKTLKQSPLPAGRITDKNKRENLVRKIRVLGLIGVLVLGFSGDVSACWPWESVDPEVQSISVNCNGECTQGKTITITVSTKNSNDCTGYVDIGLSVYKTTSISDSNAECNLHWLDGKYYSASHLSHD